jgi:hypothetical protein
LQQAGRTHQNRDENIRRVGDRWFKLDRERASDHLNRG